MKSKWNDNAWGVKVGTDLVQNLRFADDILMIGRTLPKATQMLEDVNRAVKMMGLELHP